MKKNCPPQPATAKKLLKEAGYPDGIDFTIHVSTKEPTWPTIAEVLPPPSVPVAHVCSPPTLTEVTPTPGGKLINSGVAIPVWPL